MSPAKGIRTITSLAFACLAGMVMGTARDSAAVRPDTIRAADLTMDFWVPGYGTLKGARLLMDSRSFRWMASDDSLYSTLDLDDHLWARSWRADSLAELRAPVYWLRCHFVLDTTLSMPALVLNIASNGPMQVWLDGVRLMGSSPSLADAVSLPDSLITFNYPLKVGQTGRTHVLALRLESTGVSAPVKKIRAGLTLPNAAEQLPRAGMRYGIFMGINLLVLLLALLFWRLDPKDGVWPWFAALSGTLCFIAFTSIVDNTALGLGPTAVQWLQKAGRALILVPSFLSVIVLRVLLHSMSRRLWWLYLGALMLTPLSFLSFNWIQSRINFVNLRYFSLTALWPLIVMALLIATLYVWIVIDAIRFGVRVFRSRGFVRWLGAGVLVSAGLPVLVSIALTIWAMIVGNGNSTASSVPDMVLGASIDFAYYLAVPLTIILTLAIRSAFQNRQLARQRDDLDKEVHERTAELREERDRSETLLLNILPLEVAKELKEKGAAEARHFDQASVLFSDFKGFTEMSGSVAPGELLQELNACFHAFDDIIGARGIEKIKTIGDAYMCAGGLPDPKNSSPVDVVFAALEMQEFLQARKLERERAGLFAFDMRLGIHSGPVVAGIVGVKKFQYDIWGDTVNMASRMETSGEVGRVNISAGTYALVKDVPGLRFTHRGQVTVKGKGATEMWFVERA